MARCNSCEICKNKFYFFLFFYCSKCKNLLSDNVKNIWLVFPQNIYGFQEKTVGSWTCININEIF